jgi:DMSO/TMAO reductase YedYZ molybdopterin-dependent catalytic subunit
MEKNMRILSERPLNAETPHKYLRSWITANSVFFDRNQGLFDLAPIPLDQWEMNVIGEVEKPLRWTFDEILGLPKAIAANTLECTGNGRSLFPDKASGNAWTIGGASNAVFGGVWLKTILEKTGLTPNARHVAFEGYDKALGSSGVKFIRSIPIEKALDSTLLAYEMNGEPLPVKHGYPLRALALGWYGANSVKWLSKITVMDKPFEGFYMDTVYRVFQKGQDSKTGRVVTGLVVKSTITQPLNNETLAPGLIPILGVAYAGEADIQTVEVSVDNGATWNLATFIGPHERYAWRQWQFLWNATVPGDYTIMARAVDVSGRTQPMNAVWNVLGYENNGIKEHAVNVRIQ